MNILLRRINKNDVNYFQQIKSDEKVCKYLGNPKTNNQYEIINWFNNIFNETNTDRFLIIDKNNINIIYGDICIGDINYIELSSTLHIKILHEYWGKGIGSIIIDKIILYCKDILGLKFINLSININNLRSLNLFSKFNLKFISFENNFKNYIIIL